MSFSIMKGSPCLVVFVSFILLQVNSSPVDLSPTFLFGSLRNATMGATAFISDSLRKPTEIVLQATDTATGYVANAVAKPTNMLINAKDATRDYIDRTASRGMEVKVKALIEIMRSNMPYGIPALDLPVLDPLVIEHMDFAIDSEEIGHLTSSVDNMTVSKLSTFVVDHVKVTVLEGVSLAVNVSVPVIQSDGLYRVSGTMGKLFAVNGSGPFNAEIHGAKAYLHTVLGYSGAMYVKSLDLDFSIESLKGYFHHLFPNNDVDETMNSVIADMAPDLLEIIKPEVIPKLEEIIAQRINATVGRLTMGNVIAILTGTADIHSFAHLLKPRLSL